MSVLRKGSIIGLLGSKKGQKSFQECEKDVTVSRQIRVRKITPLPLYLSLLEQSLDFFPIE